MYGFLACLGLVLVPPSLLMLLRIAPGWIQNIAGLAFAVGLIWLFRQLAKDHNR